MKLNTGIEKQADREREGIDRRWRTCTQTDGLTEHLLQREREREREGWEARMKLNAGIDRHMDRQGIETEGDVHEHRQHKTVWLQLCYKEREGRKESARQTEVGEAYMLLNGRHRTANVCYKEWEGGKEEARQREGRHVCMKLNTDIRRPDCTSITKRERERGGEGERARQTEGGEACMHEVEHRHKTAWPHLYYKEREREGERARQTEVGEACTILNTDIGRPGWTYVTKMEGRAGSQIGWLTARTVLLHADNKDREKERFDSLSISVYFIPKQNM